MEGYVFSPVQVVGVLGVCALGLYVVGYIVWKWGSDDSGPNYTAAFSAVIPALVAVALCGFILFPPGSENALRWQAQQELHKIASAKEDEARQRSNAVLEHAIREKMGDLRRRRP